MPIAPQEHSEERLYTEHLLRSVGRLRFPSVVEREFQESFYNPRAHTFITKWGLLPAVVILLTYCVSDFMGFSSKLLIIECIRVVSMIPLLVIYLTRRNPWVYTNIRDIYTVYLLFLSFTVMTIIVISPDSDFGHRGYMLSLPMLIMTMFIAKPRILVALGASTLFCVVFDLADILLEFRPLGYSDHISMLHYTLVMVTSLVIGAFTCYVLEVAERREFLQRKIIDQDKELILLQQVELSEAVNQLTHVNERLEVQNESLDLLNKQKTDFLGIAAHDLKNPLAGISLNVAAIKRYFAQMSTEEIIAALERVDEAATRMKTLVVQLLDINRLESSSVSMQWQYIRIADVLQREYVEYNDRALQKSIQLRLVCDAQLGCYTDESFLSQIVDNLLSNAIKFSPSGKTVTLRAASQMERGEEYVVIEVEDQGPGINQDEVQQLFQRYQRLSAKPTGGEHSSGLGLSIVKKMVEFIEGSVHCVSVIGHGARFVVKLPITPKQSTHTKLRERLGDVGVQHPSGVLKSVGQGASANRTIGMSLDTESSH